MNKTSHHQIPEQLNIMSLLKNDKIHHQKTTEVIYTEAIALMDKAQTPDEFDFAAEMFGQIKNYSDANNKRIICVNSALELRERKYSQAIIWRDIAKNPFELEKAITLFSDLGNFKDSKSQLDVTREMLNALNSQLEKEKHDQEEREYWANVELEKAKKRKRRRIKCIAILIIIISPFVIPALKDLINQNNTPNDPSTSTQISLHDNIPDDSNIPLDNTINNTPIPAIDDAQYQDAIKLLNDKQFKSAAENFTKFGNYKDSAEKAKEAYYYLGHEYINNGDLDQAVVSFSNAGDYSDATTLTVYYSSGLDRQIAAGSFHTIGVKKDGTVEFTGNNDEGQCDVGSWKEIYSASASSSKQTIGIKKDGTVVATGNNNDGQCDVLTWSDIIQVSTNGFHTVGLKNNGSVIAIGENHYGQCDVSNWSDIKEISTGGLFTIGLKNNGTIVAVGDNTYNQCATKDWNNIIDIATGDFHSLGLNSNGTVVATGLNLHGQCNVESWTDIIAVAAGANFSLGLKKDGTVVATGDNDKGQCDVSNWTNVIAITAGYDHTVGLLKDGSIIAIGRNDEGQCNVDGWNLWK